MDYEVKGQTVYVQTALETGTRLILQARDIRQDHGPHAIVTITAQREKGTARNLAWDDVAINKAEERTRLANKAHKYFDDSDALLLDEARTRLLLDDFCAGLWDAWIAISEPVEMAGATERKGPEYLLRPYVAKGKGSILFAPPKAGKSYVGYMIAVGIDSGKGGDLWQTQQAKTLLVNLERDAESVRQRIGNINAALGLPRNRPLLTLNAKGRRLTDVIGGVRRAVERQGVGFVLLDSLSRVGIKLVADDEVNGACDILNAACPSWLALAHTPRASADHIFGSQMWDAAADILVKLRSAQDGDHGMGVCLEMQPSNDGPKAHPKVISLEFDELGLIAAKPADLLDFPALAQDMPQDVRTQVVNYLRERGKTTATEAAQTLGLNRGRVAELLKHTRDFVALEKLGRDQLYGLAEHPPNGRTRDDALAF